MLILFGFFFQQHNYGQSYTLKEKDSIIQRIESLDGKEKFDLEIRFLEPIFNEFPEKGVQFLDDIEAFSNNSDTIDKLWAKIAFARYELLLRNYPKCISLATEVKQNNHSLPIQKYKANYLLRACYSDLDALDKALEAHLDIDWSLNQGDWESRAPEYFNSEIYFKFKEYDKAIKLIKYSIEELDETNYDYWKMSLRNSLGVYFEHANQLDSAIKYYNEALDLLQQNFKVGEDFSKEEYNFISGLFKGNIGQTLMKMGRYNEAVELLISDVEGSSVVTTHNIYKENQLISSLVLTKCYIELKEFEKAQTLLLDIENLAKLNFLQKHLSEVENVHFLYYQAKGDDSKALAHLIRSVELKDSLLEAENLDKARNLHLAYEAGLQEEKLIAKNAALADLQTKNDTQLSILVFISIGSIIIIGLCVFLFLAYRAKQRSASKLILQNEQIEKQKEQLSEALQEKEILFKEVNHRVKNNLQIVSSLLYFQAKIVKDEAARKAMKEAQSRVLSMSFIHQKLYQTEQVGVIDFNSYVTSLADHICRNANVQNTDIDLEIKAEGINISVQKAIPLGLVLHELISNSVKHAFDQVNSGIISILFEQDGPNLLLTYRDTGIGEKLEETYESPTIGKKLIFLLTSQLNGSIKQDPNKLNEIRFSFKLG